MLAADRYAGHYAAAVYYAAALPPAPLLLCYADADAACAALRQQRAAALTRCHATLLQMPAPALMPRDAI